MKKWSMLAFLPFLLLVQQEVGATPIYVSKGEIKNSQGVVLYSYSARFDFTADNSFDYLFTFDSSSKVDLHSIPPLPPPLPRTQQVVPAPLPAPFPTNTTAQQYLGV